MVRSASARKHGLIARKEGSVEETASRVTRSNSQQFLREVSVQLGATRVPTRNSTHGRDSDPSKMNDAGSQGKLGPSGPTESSNRRQRVLRRLARVESSASLVRYSSEPNNPETLTRSRGVNFRMTLRSRASKSHSEAPD